MKKLTLVVLLLSFAAGGAFSQGLLKKMAKSVVNDVAGKNIIRDKPEPGVEPACACDNPILMFDFNSGIKLNYNEIFVFAIPGGRWLVRNYSEYYFVDSGILDGPYEEEDDEISKYMEMVYDYLDQREIDPRTKEFVSEKGGKLFITFKGQEYGPYEAINQLRLSQSGENFAAIVREDVRTPEIDMQEMQKAILSAKSEEERTRIAKEYQDKMTRQAMGDLKGSPNAPHLVSNIADAIYDFPDLNNSRIYSRVKYESFIIYNKGKILDLDGETIMEVNDDPYQDISRSIFLSEDNKLVCSAYDTEYYTLADGTSLEGAFQVGFRKVNGKVYLSYQYYSPSKNGIMECLLPTDIINP